MNVCEPISNQSLENPITMASVRSKQKPFTRIPAVQTNTHISDIKLEPLEIYYSKPSISNYFEDGGSILSTLCKLVANEITSETIPPIKVDRCNGIWVVIKGNKRLLLYEMLQVMGYLDSITVHYGNYSPECITSVFI